MWSEAHNQYAHKISAPVDTELKDIPQTLKTWINITYSDGQGLNSRIKHEEKPLISNKSSYIAIKLTTTNLYPIHQAQNFLATEAYCIFHHASEYLYWYKNDTRKRNQYCTQN